MIKRQETDKKKVKMDGEEADISSLLALRLSQKQLILHFP